MSDQPDSPEADETGTVATPPIPPQPPHMPAPQPEPRTRPAWLVPVIATTVVVGITAATAGYLLASGDTTDAAAPAASSSASASATAAASPTWNATPTRLVNDVPGVKRVPYEQAVTALTTAGIAKDNIAWVSPFSDQPKPADPAGMTVCDIVRTSGLTVTATTTVDLSVIETDGTCPLQHNKPKPKPSCTQTGEYKKLSDREFKQMIRNTTAQLMDCFTIYGEIVQADSATGTTSVRANTCGEKKQPKYGFLSDCDTNSILTELVPTGKLNGVVKGDLFEAKVQLGFDTSYKTTLGGTISAPTFYVQEIKSYGSVD
ncbi:hypothetical protein ACFYYS_20000 [Streptomyces sp. NPDC002120]|uniref:hypothetical protein n=1 Tax=Streptomyces sp. NPDC002120 TaxID=3364631 RepID=UPI00369C5731